MTPLGNILIAVLVVALLVIVVIGVFTRQAWKSFNKRFVNPPAWLRNGEEERGPHGSYEDTRP
jgi:hypothetical protein